MAYKIEELNWQRDAFLVSGLVAGLRMIANVTSRRRFPVVKPRAAVGNSYYRPHQSIARYRWVFYRFSSS